MQSWRTLVSACVTAFFFFVLQYPQDFLWAPWLVHIAAFGASGGLISLGLFTKDAAVHSTADEVRIATVAKQEAAIKDSK